MQWLSTSFTGVHEQKPSFFEMLAEDIGELQTAEDKDKNQSCSQVR